MSLLAIINMICPWPEYVSYKAINMRGGNPILDLISQFLVFFIPNWPNYCI